MRKKPPENSIVDEITKTTKPPKKHPHVTPKAYSKRAHFDVRSQKQPTPRIILTYIGMGAGGAYTFSRVSSLDSSMI